MSDDEKKELYARMLRKATGYETEEVAEEYSLVDGEMTLVKRKITRKDVPPDLSALRFLIGDAPPENVSGDELEREKRELTEEFFRLMSAKLAN